MELTPIIGVNVNARSELNSTLENGDGSTIVFSDIGIPPSF